MAWLTPDMTEAGSRRRGAGRPRSPPISSSRAARTCRVRHRWSRCRSALLVVARDRHPVRRRGRALRAAPAAHLVGRARLDPVPLARDARRGGRVPPRRAHAHDRAASPRVAAMRACLEAGRDCGRARVPAADCLAGAASTPSRRASSPRRRCEIPNSWRAAALPVGIALMVLFALLRLCASRRRTGTMRRRDRCRSRWSARLLAAQAAR